MIKYLKEYRFYILLFLFLLIPLTALDTAHRAPRNYHAIDRAILKIMAPIQEGISLALDSIIDGFQNYVFLKGTRQENILLIEENRKLAAEISSLREAEQENKRLKSLLAFQEKLALKKVVARVIARDISTDFRSIRINRGENAGIKRDMAVVTHEGIVGRILRVDQNIADVVTLLDLQSAVDVIVERSRARGVVEGLTEDTAQLKFALRTDDIQPDDLLISSGLGGIFPKGIPVGKVIQVKKKKFGISQEVEVRPTVDFSRLEEVIVITEKIYDPVMEGRSGE